MPQTTYRGAAPDLQALISGASSGAAPMQAPAPVMQNATSYSPEEANLLSMLTTPTDQGPQPKEPTNSFAPKLGMAIGDALSTYASVLGRFPLETHTLDRYLAQVEKQKEDLQKWQERHASAVSEAKLRGAQFILGRKAQEAATKQAQIDKLEFQANALQQKKDEITQRAADAEAQRQVRLDVEQKQTERDLAVQKATGITQEKVARINANVDKTQARVDKKDLGEAITFIGQTALNAKSMLEGVNGQAPRSPEEIMKVVQVTLDGLTLTKDARDAADAYVAKELGPILHDYSVGQQNEALAAGSPQTGGFNLIDWMKERFGGSGSK